MNETKVRPASGKLGVMCVGLGAVTTTTIIGTLMARKGLSKPIGARRRPFGRFHPGIRGCGYDRRRGARRAFDRKA